VVKSGAGVEVEVEAGAATSSVVSPSVDHSSARQSTTTGLSLRTQSAVHEDVDVPRLTTRCVALLELHETGLTYVSLVPAPLSAPSLRTMQSPTEALAMTDAVSLPLNVGATVRDVVGEYVG